MKIDITYKEVSLRYPLLVLAIDQKRSISNSVSRNTPLDQCNWSIKWGTSCPSSPLTDVPKRKTLDGMITNDLSRVCCVALECRKNRGYWSTQIDVRKYGIPKEIVNIVNSGCEDAKIEQDRINAMTPEERESEFIYLLKELSKDPSFRIIR